MFSTAALGSRAGNVTPGGEARQAGGSERQSSLVMDHGPLGLVLTEAVGVLQVGWGGTGWKGQEHWAGENALGSSRTRCASIG